MSVSGLTPGEQGSVYGEEAWLELGQDGEHPVGIEKILAELGIPVGGLNWVIAACGR